MTLARLLPALFATAALALAQPQPRWTIDTVAGAVPGPIGPALDAFLEGPAGVAFDPNGNVLVSDPSSNWIRRITALGTISVFAGTGEPSLSPDGSVAAESPIQTPSRMISTAAGEVYFYDPNNRRIHRVDTRGIITTAVGNGRFVRDATPAGEPATEFPVFSVTFLAFDDQSSTLYVGLRDRVWRVQNGMVFPFAGTGERGFAGDGGPADQAQFEDLSSAAVAPDGALIVMDRAGRRFRRIEADGSLVATIIGNGDSDFNVIPDGTVATETALDSLADLAFNSAGMLHFVSGRRDLYRLEADGTLVRVVRLTHPSNSSPNVTDMVFAPDDRLIIADSQDRSVVEYAGDYSQPRLLAGGSNLRGDDGPALEARFQGPEDVAFDSVGNMLVADTSNRAIRSIAADGTITRVAGTGVPFILSTLNGRMPLEAAIGFVNHVDVAADDAPLFQHFRGIHKIPAGGPIEVLPGFVERDASVRFGAFAYGPDGSVFFENSANNTVLRHAPDGTLTPVAGNGERGFSGDGGAALAASFNSISDLDVDDQGNLYIADANNRRVRMVSAIDGTVSTIAGTGVLGRDTLSGLAREADMRPRSIFVTSGPSPELFISGFRLIHRVYNPNGAALTAEGRPTQGIGANALVATIAGSSTGFSGDGGDATMAELSDPEGMALGPDGRLYFADRGNHRIRALTPTFAPLLQDNAVTDAAGFGQRTAPDAIVSLFGQLLALETAAATAVPLPTELAGASIEVVDSAGAIHPADLFFVSERQANFLMPPDAAIGPATVRLTRDGDSAESAIEISQVAPGLFTMNATGSGVGAIVAIVVAADGTRSNPPVFEFNASTGQFVSVPIEVAPDAQIFLSLFGTGIRGLGDATLSATVGGEPVPVLGFAPSAQFLGLDQVNIGPLPASLAGDGPVAVQLSIDGIESNEVEVNIGATRLPPA